MRAKRHKRKAEIPWDIGEERTEFRKYKLEGTRLSEMMSLNRKKTPPKLNNWKGLNDFVQGNRQKGIWVMTKGNNRRGRRPLKEMEGSLKKDRCGRIKKQMNRKHLSEKKGD